MAERKTIRVGKRTVVLEKGSDGKWRICRKCNPNDHRTARAHGDTDDDQDDDVGGLAMYQPPSPDYLAIGDDEAPSMAEEARHAVEDVVSPALRTADDLATKAAKAAKVAATGTFSWDMIPWWAWLGIAYAIDKSRRRR